MAILSQHKLWTILALVFSLLLTVQPAEAKKFGGGKSFGKSFQTTPAQPRKPIADTPAKSNTAPAAQSNKKGLMGGLLGGLLAGGLIAALLGGAFEGLQIMDILIFAGLAFLLYKLFSKKRPQRQAATPAYSGSAPSAFSAPEQNTQQRAPLFDFKETASGGSTDNNASPFATGGFTSGNDIPFNLPPGFDVNGFLQGARDHYKNLQTAWNTNNFDEIQDYVSPELFNLLKQERQSLAGEQHTEVMFVDAELVRAETTAQSAEISLKFSGRYRDTVEGIEDDITDIWHLEKDLTIANAPWYIVGIQA